jgi:hypothetical protein
MIGHLYRYPHPFDSTRFIYVGQGAKRDSEHRSGRTSFGRKFKIKYPNVSLPQPIRKDVEIENRFELNELETIWMFQYHTWRGYEDGMNVTFPGSLDYRVAGTLGSREDKSRAGRLGGAVSGPISGRICKEKEIGIFSPALDRVTLGRMGGKIGGPKAAKTNRQNGTGIFDSKVRQKGGSLGGSISGPSNGRIQGRKNIESGHIQKLGLAQGFKNAQSGHMKRIQKLGASLSGQIAAKSGRLAVINVTARHIRWHVNRNRPNPRCSFCSEQNLVVAFA